MCRCLFEEEVAKHPEGYPSSSHDPPWRCETIEYSVLEPDLVEDTAEEGACRYAKHLSDNKEGSESGAPADSYKARVGAVPFVVHETNERDTRDHSANEYHVEEVGTVGEGIDDIAEDGATVCKLEASIVTAYGPVSGCVCEHEGSMHLCQIA